jgi:hypothetical protein
MFFYTFSVTCIECPAVDHALVTRIDENRGMRTAISTFPGRLLLEAIESRPAGKSWKCRILVSMIPPIPGRKRKAQQSGLLDIIT